MIAWCGSRAGGLGWLSDRCRSLDDLEIVEAISIEDIDAICNQKPRRLILSVENRLDYPLAEIQHLQRSWPEVPWALAAGSWFDGSRRTGVGATKHLSLSWYRWWDGWHQWLSGSNHKLLNPWPNIVLGRSLANGNVEEECNASGIILCNCRQTATAWQLGLECDPEKTQLLTSHKVRSPALGKTAVATDWVLWDDTCLDTSNGAGGLPSVCGVLADIRTSYPEALIIAATCMPRWCDWQQWMAAGADELIAKPTQGVSLRDMLLNAANARDQRTVNHSV